MKNNLQGDLDLNTNRVRLKLEKLRWYLPFFFAAVLICSLPFLYRIWRENSKEDQLRLLSRDLKVGSSKIDFRLKGNLEYLQRISHQISLNRLKAGDFADRVGKYHDFNSEMVEMGWIDKNFKYMAKFTPSKLEKLDITSAIPRNIGRDMRRRLNEDTDFFYTDVFSAIGGFSAIAVMVPILDKNDQYLGAVYAVYSLKKLLTETLEKTLSEQYSLAILDPSNKILASIEDAEKMEDLEVSDVIQLALPDTDSESAFMLKLTHYKKQESSFQTMAAAGLLGFTLLGLLLTTWALARYSQKQKDAETALRIAKESAESANKTKSELVANISHEVRTPIGAILGYARLIENQTTEDGAIYSKIKAIQRNSKHLLEIVNDLLDLSKIEAGMLEIDKVMFSLPTEISEVIGLLKQQIEEKNNLFEVDYKFPIPEFINSDPKRFRQILTNLLSNAVKFTDNGKIEIGIGYKEGGENSEVGHINIEVKDNGIGVPKNRQEDIFRAFVQADSTISRKFGGTGLGLALSKRLANSIGGDVRLINSEENEGSTFLFSLEVEPTPKTRMIYNLDEYDSREIIPKYSEKYENLLDNVHILIIEDCLDNQVIYRQYLESAGAKVEIADSGVGGIKMTLRQVPDLILMDIQMPEMDGYQTTRTIREEGIKIPIIALTAHAMKGEKQRCLDAGCNEYLAKPVEPERLIYIIRSYVRGRDKPINKNHLRKKPEITASLASKEDEYPDFSEKTEPLKSLHIADPRVSNIVEGFVGNLVVRIESIKKALKDGNLPQVSKIAHQLKGTSASYGYPIISETSAEIEEKAKEDGISDEILYNYIEKLEILANRANLAFKEKNQG